MGQPPPPPAQPPPAEPPASRAPPAAQRPAGDVPDDEFIEFLGEDDHGDTAWWEFLKKTPPGTQDPAPGQEAPRQ